MKHAFVRYRFKVYFVHILERHISYAARPLHAADPSQSMGAHSRLERAHPLSATHMSVDHVLQPVSPCMPPWRSTGRVRGIPHPFALRSVRGQGHLRTGGDPQSAAECSKGCGLNDNETHIVDRYIKVHSIGGGLYGEFRNSEICAPILLLPYRAPS